MPRRTSRGDIWTGDGVRPFQPMRSRCGRSVDAARWVAERTRETVEGLSIDEEPLAEVLLEIHGALAAGEVRAWAHTPNDPVPRELPNETWAIYQLAIEERNGLLFIVPDLGASPNQERAPEKPSASMTLRLPSGMTCGPRSRSIDRS